MFCKFKMVKVMFGSLLTEVITLVIAIAMMQRKTFLFNSQDDHTDTSRPQPSAPTIETVKATTNDQQHRASFHDQNCDVSELHGFDVQGGSGQAEDEQSTQNREHHSKGSTINANNSENRDKQNRSSNTNRRQSTLTRQSGIHNESDSRNSVDDAPSFDLRTEDGNIVVVVSNLDMEDQQEEIIDMEDGDIEIDCEENLEYSSVRLQQGHGSASSVHSEADNADNCSISVALSVSSLGSDNEEVVYDDDLIDYPDESNKQKQRRGEVMDSQAQVRQLKLISECLCVNRIQLSVYQFFMIININNNGNIIIIPSPFVITYCTRTAVALTSTEILYHVIASVTPALCLASCVQRFFLNCNGPIFQ